MSRKQPVIRVDNVTQRFRRIEERPDTVRDLFVNFFRHRSECRRFDAIKNVSLDVYRGEMLGIVGHNGSGKSTLLKMIAGIYTPSAGGIEVIGKLAPLIELGAGFHPELTGRENAILNGLLLGFSRREMLAREQSIHDFAELGEFIDSPVKQYSSGMYMRLAFAVAAQVNPDIILIDEILAVGDTEFQQKCFAWLNRFRSADKTIVLVTHNLQQITEFCDRAVLLEHGQLVVEGTPDEVIEAYSGSSASETAVQEAVIAG